MSYRNPRFSYRHMMREYKTVGVSGSTSSVSSGAVANLYDDRSSPLVMWLLSSNKELRLAKSDAVDLNGQLLTHHRLNRLFIPAGHALVGASWKIRLDEDFALSAPVEPVLVDGVAYKRHIAPTGLIDVELKSTEALADWTMAQLRLFDSMDNSNYGFGELWWTDTVQPTTGIAVGWEDTFEGIYDRSETRSGKRYTQQRGDSKWRGGFTHRALSGADLKLYDDLYRYINYGQFPFWYEHPDSADAEILFEDWSSTFGGFTTTNSASLQTIVNQQPDGENGNHIKLHSGNNVNVEWSYPVSATDAPNADWTNKVLRVQIKPDWNAVASTNLKFFLESQIGANAARTTWDCGKGFNLASSEDWTRLEIDLSTQATESTGAAGPADLVNPTRFGFITHRPSTNDATYFGDLFLLDKTKQPRLVEVINYQRFQDSPAPSGAQGPTYSVVMSLLEVTT